MNMLMSTLQLNAELYRVMGEIADDESMMERVLKYVKRLAAKKNDPTLMTKEEFFAKIDRSLEEARNGNVTRQLPGESVAEMLKRTGYAV